MVVDVSTAGGGAVRMTAPPVSYSDPQAGASVRLPPPLLGQHSREVLRDVLGLTDDRVTALAAEGVVGLA
jgi:succinate---hydroxymethylglutarate CoA-transferase